MSIDKNSGLEIDERYFKNSIQALPGQTLKEIQQQRKRTEAFLKTLTSLFTN